VHKGNWSSSFARPEAASIVRGKKFVCAELSPEKLAELADFYKPRRAPVNPAELAKAAAKRAQAKPQQSYPRGSDTPLEGELNYARTSLLRFGQESRDRKTLRPVMALGVIRPPFYLALPMTTQKSHGRGFFKVLPEDYEANIGDDRRWPKWLHWRHENVPLNEERRYLGRLREATMTRVNSWREEHSARPNPRKRSP
jgi:hypothetical protein